MFNVPAILTGAVGTALLAVSFAPGLGSDTSFAAGSNRAPTVMRAAKGDRLGAPVAVVQRLDPPEAVPAPSRGDDAVLFGRAPLANGPAFFANTPQPMAVLQKRQQAPAFREPVTRQEGMDGPQKRRSPAVGCMASVSPLAQASADQPPGLCLAFLSPLGHTTDGAAANPPA